MAALRRDFMPADARREMARAGFDACVAVQVRQTLDETRWLLALADAHPFIVGVVGWVDLQAPDVDAQLEDVADHPKLVGLRHIVQAEPDGFLGGAAFRRGIASLERFGLPYDILVYARQLPEAIEFAAAFPTVSGSCWITSASLISGATGSGRGVATSAGWRRCRTSVRSCRGS